jgi:hypothetical protein
MMNPRLRSGIALVAVSGGRRRSRFAATGLRRRLAGLQGGPALPMTIGPPAKNRASFKAREAQKTKIVQQFKIEYLSLSRLKNFYGNFGPPTDTNWKPEGGRIEAAIAELFIR